MSGALGKIALQPQFLDVVSNVEPLNDQIFGPLYRCELTLKDGTFLPCAILQSKTKLVELARRRVLEETGNKPRLGGPDPFGQILSAFVARGNRVNDYDVKAAAPSRYAPPLSLLEQIHGETTMAWTGWVFEMSDGAVFSYGSSFNMEFLDLPAGYSFDNIVKVHDHSYISTDGALVMLTQGGAIPTEYPKDRLLRERVFFKCAIEGI